MDNYGTNGAQNMMYDRFSRYDDKTTPDWGPTSCSGHGPDLLSDESVLLKGEHKLERKAESFSPQSVDVCLRGLLSRNRQMQIECIETLSGFITCNSFSIDDYQARGLFSWISESITCRDLQIARGALTFLLAFIPMEYDRPYAKSCMTRVVAPLISALGDIDRQGPALEVLYLSAQCIGMQAKILDEVVRSGLSHSSYQIRLQSFQLIEHLVSGEMGEDKKIEFKSLIYGIVDRLDDSHSGVVKSAERALGQLRQKIRDFHVYIRNLEYAQQALVREHAVKIKRYADQYVEESKRERKGPATSALDRNDDRGNARRSSTTPPFERRREPSTSATTTKMAAVVVTTARPVAATADARTVSRRKSSAPPSSSSSSSSSVPSSSLTAPNHQLDIEKEGQELTEKKRTTTRSLAFGLIPPDMIADLSNVSDTARHLRAFERLRKIVKELSPDDVRRLKRDRLSCGKLFEFMRTKLALAYDPDVAIVTLEVVECLIRKIGRQSRSYIRDIFDPLKEKVGDLHRPVRQAAQRVWSALSACMSPEGVLTCIRDEGLLRHVNSFVREGGIKILIHVLLTHETGLDMNRFAHELVDLLRDDSPVVRYAATEACAVLNSVDVETNVLRMLTRAGLRDADVEDSIRERFLFSELPYVGKDNCIVFVNNRGNSSVAKMRIRSSRVRSNMIGEILGQGGDRKNVSTSEDETDSSFDASVSTTRNAKGRSTPPRRVQSESMNANARSGAIRKSPIVRHLRPHNGSASLAPAVRKFVFDTDDDVGVGRRNSDDYDEQLRLLPSSKYADTSSTELLLSLNDSKGATRDSDRKDSMRSSHSQISTEKKESSSDDYSSDHSSAFGSPPRRKPWDQADVRSEELVIAGKGERTPEETKCREERRRPSGSQWGVPERTKKPPLFPGRDIVTKTTPPGQNLSISTPVEPAGGSKRAEEPLSPTSGRFIFARAVSSEGRSRSTRRENDALASTAPHRDVVVVDGDKKSAATTRQRTTVRKRLSLLKSRGRRRRKRERTPSGDASDASSSSILSQSLDGIPSTYKRGVRRVARAESAPAEFQDAAHHSSAAGGNDCNFEHPSMNNLGVGIFTPKGNEGTHGDERSGMMDLSAMKSKISRRRPFRRSESDDSSSSDAPKSLHVNVPDSADDDRPLRPMAGAASPDCYARAVSVFGNDSEFARADTAPNGNHSKGRQHTVSRATLLARQRRAARRAQLTVGEHTSGERRKAVDLAKGIFTPKATSTPKYFAAPTDISDEGGPAAFERTKKQYTATSELEPCENPSKVMRLTLKELGGSSTEWAKQFDALNNVRRLAQHHADVLKPHLHSAVLRLVDCIKSLRSQIAKNGLMCARDLFDSLGTAMDSEMETIAPPLLKRATDTNSFVKQEADAALVSMATRCSPLRVLGTFAGFRQHKSAPIRTKAAYGLQILAENVAPRLWDIPHALDKLVRASGGCLLDRAAPTRAAGREIIWSLQRSGHFDGDDGVRLRQLVSETALPRLNEALRCGKLNGGKKSSSSPSKRRGDGNRERKKRTSSRERYDDRDRSDSKGGRGSDRGGGKPPRHRRSDGDEPIPKNVDDALKSIFEDMSGSDWRKRKVATERLTILVERTGPKTLAPRTFAIFEHFNQRMADGNVKVSIVALESVDRIVPLFKGHLSTVVPMLVRTLAHQLGSTNKKVGSICLQTFDTLIVNVPETQICPEITSAATYSLNNYSRTILLERLCCLLPAVQKKKPRQVTSLIVPVAFKFLAEMRGPIEAVNTRLLKAIHRAIGSKLMRMASSELSRPLLRRLEGAVGRGK